MLFVTNVGRIILLFVVSGLLISLYRATICDILFYLSTKLIEAIIVLYIY